MKKEDNKLTKDAQKKFIEILKIRFCNNMHLHKDIEWEKIEQKLKTNGNKLWSLHEMERTGGEPDVLIYDNETGEYIFYDFSQESPQGRRSLCYDQEALESRSKNKPVTSAIGMAAEMGVEILTEEEYRELQKFGNFDKKTSSWVKTPDKIRNLGGAVFCDRRYDTVFLYHNSAESYYSSRGFRAMLRI